MYLTNPRTSIYAGRCIYSSQPFTMAHHKSINISSCKLIDVERRLQNQTTVDSIHEEFQQNNCNWMTTSNCELLMRRWCFTFTETQTQQHSIQRQWQFLKRKGKLVQVVAIAATTTTTTLLLQRQICTQQNAMNMHNSTLWLPQRWTLQHQAVTKCCRSRHVLLYVFVHLLNKSIIVVNRMPRITLKILLKTFKIQ